VRGRGSPDAQAAIVDAWRRGKIEWILSPEILEEYRKTGKELAADDGRYGVHLDCQDYAGVYTGGFPRLHCAASFGTKPMEGSGLA